MKVTLAIAALLGYAQSVRMTKQPNPWSDDNYDSSHEKDYVADEKHGGAQFKLA